MQMTGLKAIRIPLSHFIYKAFKHLGTNFVPNPKALFLIHPALLVFFLMI